MGVYNSIIKGTNEAIEYENGNISAKISTVSSAPPPDFENSNIESEYKSTDEEQH